jgi:uncharacterized protein (DUF2132 family)
MTEQPNNPLHGVKLAEIVEHLVEKFGWEELAEKININCFKTNPSVKSSLKFLRKTPWAREKVERLYLRSIGKRVPRNRPPRQAFADQTEPAKPFSSPNRSPEPGQAESRLDESEASESPWAAAKRAREAKEQNEND